MKLFSDIEIILFSRNSDLNDFFFQLIVPTQKKSIKVNVLFWTVNNYFIPK